MPKPNTTYANVVNVRTTPTELVLDFGFEGASEPSQNPEPEVRVIMTVAATRRLGELLINAARQHEKELSQGQMPAEGNTK